MPSELKKPEPAFKLHWDSERACYTVSKPNIGDTDCYTAAQLEQYAADRVREALERAAWKTADGKRVQSGDKVWVKGSVGVHETTVSEPVTTYELFGPIPVSRSYSTKKALLTALRTLKEQTK